MGDYAEKARRKALREYEQDVDRYHEEMQVLEPLHVIEIDEISYHIRRDFYGRYQGYQVTTEGMERSVGRIQGYVSVKEVWDMLYERTIQPDASRVGAALDLVRAQYAASSDPVVVGRAREALEKEGVPLS